MKKITALLLALILLAAFAACGTNTPAATDTPAADTAAPTDTAGSETPAAAETPASAEPEQTVTQEPEAEPVELVFFAAASMTETLNEIIELYKDVAPNVTIVLTFDSSGTLKTQIEEGAACDIFISAAQKQMNQLDIAKDEEANPDRLDFVLSETRTNLLENKVVLVVPEGNSANITGFADIANSSLIALGNSDVPVGGYSLEILEYLGLDIAEMEAAGLVSYGTNVKEVTTQVSEGAVDCGIVYATDAYSAGLQVVEIATTDMCKQVVYPAAVMKSCENVEAAQAFLDFLKTPDAAAVFEEVGFTMVG